MVEPQDTGGRPKNTEQATRDLALRIALAKRERASEDNRASADTSQEMNGMARGMRIGTEFIAAIVVGGLMGYLIDLGLGSSPWGMLIMLMVGFAAGVTNVTRLVTKMNSAPTAATGSIQGPDVSEEVDKR